MNTAPLAVTDLNVTFATPAGDERAVDGLSIEVRRGETVALVGESGCGKSVSALAILGLLPRARASVNAASIRVAGRELAGLAEGQLRRIRGRDIAMVFQEPGTALDPVFTIGWQLARVIRRRLGMGRRGARQLALRALGQCGLPNPDDILAAYPHQLSGGMRQLVMVAMATVVEPAVLIADEPTTALDVTTQSLVLDQLARLCESSGTAVLLISHDLGVVASGCSRVMVMYCGRVVEQADYRDLFAHPRHPYSAGLMAAVPRIARDGGEVPRVQPIGGQVPSLSDLPGGCHFAPRCPFAEADCLTQRPRLTPNGWPGVACHHPLK